MVPLPGFTDNPLITRSDVTRAAKALVLPLEQHRSPLGARVKIRPASSAGFDDVAAQLEGFCRPLLAIGALIDDGEDGSGTERLRRWCRGLENGVDPSCEEYWGDLSDKDQRMVEMESISIALLSAPDVIIPMISEEGRRNLRRWLGQINNRIVPENNWRWFRIFANLVLTQLLGVPVSDVKGRMEGDLALLDGHYMGEGWSSDGPWGESRKQADYYSGSFAIQFCQLLFVRFALDYEERKEMYRRQAREFGAQYWRYFDIDGAAIPFGRSMTYRFAFAAFWAAAAVAGVELPAPVDKLGTVKGLLLRHLRWWTKHGDMFNSDGVLNIGFTYPNMYLSELYNSPQSVYWCLKSFVALVVPEDHDFWKCEELPHPLARSTTFTKGRQGAEPCKTIWPPRHIIDGSSAHHYMLSSGQMTTMPHKARDAKYCKFAYSSAFGFSVPSGADTLGQLAPDSTLSVSIDGGESWKVRSESTGVHLTKVSVGEEGDRIESLTSTWKPWKALGLEIETTLVPLAKCRPGWHVRIHRVRWTERTMAALLSDRIRLVDGGFAIPATTARGLLVPEVSPCRADSTTLVTEGYCTDGVSAMIRSASGTGGVFNLSPDNIAESSRGSSTLPVQSEAFVLDADPNTNLILSRTFIPCVRHDLVLEGSSPSPTSTSTREVRLVTGVFAVQASRVSERDLSEWWRRKPSIVLGTTELGTSNSVMVET